MTDTKIIKPYGLWSSPVSAAMLSQRLRLEDVMWDSDDFTLVWLEGRSGRGVLVCQTEDGARRDLAVEQNVRAGVGYGGGDFTVSQGIIFFVDRSGRIYRRGLGHGLPKAITPPYGNVASPTLSPDGAWLAFVFSDGHTDLIALVDAQGRDWPVKLAQGSDFYMQPAWHPSGEMLAWVEWSHPNMPWDGTRLRLGRLAGAPPHLAEDVLIAGDDHTPVSQPAFSPDGRWLSYISGDGEWESLVLYNLESREKRVLIKGDGFLLSQPAWVQGMRSYGWSASGKKIFSIRNQAGFSSLWMVDVQSGETTGVDISPYTWIEQLSVSQIADRLVFLASAPGIPNRVVCWDGQRLKVVCHSEPEAVPPEMFSSPRDVAWKVSDGSMVHGLYYPPNNLDFEGEGFPPAICYIHGGPTSAESVSYDAERVYFTTRGYAWLEVNYRGSTGYGRSYQDALREHWGETDTEDALEAAHFLAQEKLADPGRLVIMGGSAGGYTVLNSLVHNPGVFKAGICRYGVGNLFTLAMDTHKFEERYLDSMVGPLPAAAARYHAWSPLFFADKIRDPLAVFQGTDDKVVPPAQSEEIVAALRQNGVPHIYRLYEGEGHGFRKSESIADFLQQTERFLQQHVLFSI